MHSMQKVRCKTDTFFNRVQEAGSNTELCAASISLKRRGARNNRNGNTPGTLLNIPELTLDKALATRSMMISGRKEESPLPLQTVLETQNALRTSNEVRRHTNSKVRITKKKML